MTSPLDTGNRWAVLGVTVFLLSASALIADQARAYVAAVVDCYLALTVGRGVTTSRQCRPAEADR